MHISFSGIKIPGLNFNTKPSTSNVLKKQEPDSFVSSKPSLDDAVEIFENIKKPDGTERFTEDESDMFRMLYGANKIDLDTVKAFSDTSLDIQDMSNIHNLYNSSLKQGIDLKKGGYEQIHSQIKEIEAQGRTPDVKFGETNPKGELVINDSDTKTTYVFDRNGQKVSKSHVRITENDERALAVTTTEDYKANSVSKKYQLMDKNTYLGNLGYVKTVKEVTRFKDENGNTKFSRVATLSDEVDGAVNIKNVYHDGTVKDISKATKDKETGEVTVKKDMTSPDGTRTEYSYKDSPDGNRVVDYQITDNNGKILYKNHQSFEKISENKFISTNDSRKYEITTDDKSITVKQIGLDKEVSVNFRDKIEEDNQNEVISLLKKVPGHLLFEAAEDIEEYNGMEPENIMSTACSPTDKTVTTTDNLYAFLHELGHIKDSETCVDFYEEKGQYSGDKKIQKTYMQEYENFAEKYSHEQRKETEYFLENENHSYGKWSALSEVVAETNAIGSSMPDKDSDSISFRSEYLMENFPKTIAEIKNAMKWKDEADAIEYYGT